MTHNASTAVRARPGVYPMTYEQESLWLDDHLDRGPSRYLESWACRLTGRLDVAAAEWAIGEIVRRHQVLRSRLVLDSGELMQVVSEPHQVNLVQRSCAPEELPTELDSIVAQPLDLDVAPLRPWLLRLGPTDFVLVVQFHHAVIDDWALGIFEREFSELYSGRVFGRSPDLDPMPLQVGGYAIAQRAAGLDPAHLAYWEERVHDVTPCTVPPDRQRPDLPCHAGDRLRFSLSADLGRLVRASSRAKRTTPFTVFAAAMAAMLSLQSGRSEVIFGTPVSRRGSAALSQMIGCLTDLLPLRISVSQEASLEALVEKAKAEVLGALRHKDVPYEAVMRQFCRRRSPGMVTLCPTALVVDDADHNDLKLPDLDAARLYIPSGRSKFDLCLTLVIQNDGGYLGLFDYAAELYSPGTAARVVSQFTDVLRKGLAVIDQPLQSVLGQHSGGHP